MSPTSVLPFPGVHLDHQVTLGAPLEPVVKDFSLHVAQVFVPGRPGRQRREDIPRMDLGIGGGRPCQPAEIQSGHGMLLSSIAFLSVVRVWS